MTINVYFNAILQDQGIRDALSADIMIQVELKTEKLEAKKAEKFIGTKENYMRTGDAGNLLVKDGEKPAKLHGIASAENSKLFIKVFRHLAWIKGIIDPNSPSSSPVKVESKAKSKGPESHGALITENN